MERHNAQQAAGEEKAVIIRCVKASPQGRRYRRQLFCISLNSDFTHVDTIGKGSGAE
jgi:hypothetical protein